MEESSLQIAEQSLFKGFFFTSEWTEITYYTKQL